MAVWILPEARVQTVGTRSRCFRRTVLMIAVPEGPSEAKIPITVRRIHLIRRPYAKRRGRRETMFDCPLSKTVKILDQRSCSNLRNLEIFSFFVPKKPGGRLAGGFFGRKALTTSMRWISNGFIQTKRTTRNLLRAQQDPESWRAYSFALEWDPPHDRTIAIGEQSMR